MGHQFESSMLWAASFLGFFGFMRAGEFTMTSPSKLPSICASDVAVDSHLAPSVLRIFLRKAKTDPFGKGVVIFVGRTNSPICLVAALLGYLSIHLALWSSGLMVPRFPRSAL